MEGSWVGQIVLASSVFRLPRRIKTNSVDIKGKIENGLKTQGSNLMKLKHYDQIENTP